MKAIYKKIKAIYKKIKAIDKYIKATQEAIECIKTSAYYDVFSTETRRQKDIAKKQVKTQRLVTKKLDCLKMMQIVLEREIQKTETALLTGSGMPTQVNTTSNSPLLGRGAGGEDFRED